MKSIDLIHRLRKGIPPSRWRVFWFLSATYFFVYFHRVSTSVIVPDLMMAFQAQATALAFMNSMYFHLYAVEQPLVGFLADRFGPIRVVVLWTLIAACGCFLFGAAPTIGWATAGRALIGFGAGGVYVPVMKALSQWFNQEEFSTLIGFILGVGNLGGIVATTPLAWAAHHWGWRIGFIVIGITTLGLAITNFIFIGDRITPSISRAAKNRAPASTKQSSWISILRILGSFRFWLFAFIFFGAFGSYLTLQGLWATPFLMSLFELTRMQASKLNMLIPIGFILGAPLCGFLADHFDRKKPHLIIVLLGVDLGIWTAIVFGMDSLTIVTAIPLLLILGGANGGLGTVLWSIVRETTPGNVLGLTTGLLNPFVFVGSALFQIWTGHILDHAGIVNGNYPPFAYHRAFIICFFVICMSLSLSIYFRRELAKKG